MIIVSQNKKEIFNFNEIFRLYVDNWSNEEFATELNYFCIRAEKPSDNIICAYLGEYKTEERAKEVLAHIYNCYSAFETFRAADATNQNTFANEFIKKGIKPFVIEMPEE